MIAEYPTTANFATSKFRVVTTPLLSNLVVMVDTKRAFLPTDFASSPASNHTVSNSTMPIGVRLPIGSCFLQETWLVLLVVTAVVRRPFTFGSAGIQAFVFVHLRPPLRIESHDNPSLASCQASRLGMSRKSCVRVLGVRTFCIEVHVLAYQPSRIYFL